MTQEQQDAAWRSLPEDYKGELHRKYKPFVALGEAGVINAEMLMLEDLFGKHNLTASEEKKPRFKVGDCVKVYISNNSVYRKGDVCLVMSVIKDNNGYHYELDRSKAMLISEEFLGPYTEEQESREEENAAYMMEMLANARKGYISHMQALKDLEKKLKSESLKLESMDNDTPKPGTPDWLAYRMELAKELAVAAMSRKGCIDINEMMDDVDGIIEQLKGGMK